jgi:hypothetical protein
MNGNTFMLEKTSFNNLTTIIRKYTNLFKALYLIDPSIAAEFKKKQEHFHKIEHGEHSGGGCCDSKLNCKSKCNFKLSLYTKG